MGSVMYPLLLNHTKQFHSPKKVSCASLNWPSLSLYPWQLLICFPSLKFCLFRILYKWKHAMCNFTKLTYFTYQYAFSFHPCCYVDWQPIFPMVNSLWQCTHTIVCLSIHLLEHFWVVSNFCGLGIKLYKYLNAAICVNTSFQIHWVNN
jgi:hypothetical protein